MPREREPDRVEMESVRKDGTIDQAEGYLLHGEEGTGDVIPGEQAGASVDWADVEENGINLKTTVDDLDLKAIGDGATLRLTANGVGGIIQLSAPGDAGDVKIFLRSPDGTSYKIVVDDAGVLSTEAD